MDPILVAFLVAIAVLTGIPGWLTGAILRKHALQEGETPNDWIPLSLLPYAFGRFRHPNRLPIVLAYLLMNLLSWAALVTLVVLYLSRR